MTDNNMLRKVSSWTVMVLLCLSSIQAASAAPNLTLSHSYNTNGSITVTVNLENSVQPISGAQFDINYNSSELSYIDSALGSAAVSTHIPYKVAEVAPGVVRVVLAPLNNDNSNYLAYGPIVQLLFNKIGTVSPTTVTPVAATLGDPTAVSVALGMVGSDSINWNDIDNDGLPNEVDPDDDGDGIDDWYENKYGLNSTQWNDPNANVDGDDWTLLQEFQHNTDWNNWDTDGDNVADSDDPNPLIDDALIPVIMQIINSLLLD